MEKIKFYSVVFHDGQITLQENNGYSDGVYCYYRAKNSCKWYAILPDTGVSVASARTRKEAASAAHEQRIINFLNSDEGKRRRDWYQRKFRELLDRLGIKP